MFKKLIVSLILLIILLFSTGCTEDPPYALYNYPLSKWQSIDGNITIYIGSDHKGYGNFIVEKQNINVVFEFYLDVRCWCYSIDDYWNGGTIDSVENWQTKCSDGKFIATVEKTTYFEVGQEFTFVLVEDNLSEEDIPYPVKPEEESKNKETITQYI